MIFIPRFAAMVLGILVRPAGGPAVDRSAEPAPVARFDAAHAVFVGTVLDVWHLGDRQVARFVVERPAKGTRAGEIIGIVGRAEGDATLGVGERWMVVANPWLETA